MVKWVMASWGKLNQLQLIFLTWQHQEIMNIQSKGWFITYVKGTEEVFLKFGNPYGIPLFKAIKCLFLLWTFSLIFTGILIFWFPGWASYVMRVTATYSCEGLVTLAQLILDATTGIDALNWVSAFHLLLLSISFSAKIDGTRLE